MIEGYFPAWLGVNLLDGTLPWDKAAKVTLPEFLEQYSLHDSSFVGLFFRPGYETVALIGWDTSTPLSDPLMIPTITERSAVPHDWPFLLIQFLNLYEIHFDNKNAVHWPVLLMFSQSVILSSIEREAMLEHSLLRHVTSDTFELLSGKVEILHGAEVMVLCVDNTQTLHPIPGFTNQQ